MTRMYTNYCNLCGSGKLICNKYKVIIIMNPQVIWEYRQNSPYPSNTQNRFWSLEPVNVPSHSHGHVLIYSTADLKIRKLSYTPHLIIWVFENSNLLPLALARKVQKIQTRKSIQYAPVDLKMKVITWRC